MTRRLTLLVILASLTGVPANAQTPLPVQAPQAPRFLDAVNGLTLDQAIASALEREPALRAARTDIDAARGARVQAELRPNPTISFAQQTEPRGTDAQTRVEMQWPLDLFRKDGRVAVADLEITAARYAVSDRERLLAADVRMKFGEVLTAVRELSVIDEAIAIATRQQALVTARAEAGAVPPLDRDLIQVERQRLEADGMLQAGHAEHALIELKRLLGLPADTPLALREDLEQLVRRESAAVLAAAPEAVPNARPDVDEARARIGVADARIDQAHRDGRFDMSLFGMYMRTDAGFPQHGFGAGGELERVRGVFHYAAGGVTVSLPFRNQNQGELATAQAQRMGAQARLDATMLTAQAEVAAALARDEHARRALAVYSGETMALARRNLDVVGQTYELGRMTLLDVLNERRRYLETERAYTNALREAYDARQALRRALGEVR